MKKENLEEDGRTLWNNFTEDDSSDFWNNYETLLAQAKNTQQFRLQAIIDKENEVELQPLVVMDISKAALLTNALAAKPAAKHFFRHNYLPLLVLVGIFSFSMYMYSKYAQGDDSKRKEQWMYASLNKKERRSFDYLMNREEKLHGFTNRGKKLDYLIYKFNLIDWSKTPANLNDTTRKIYQLFDPGYKEIHYTEYKPGRFRQVVQVLGKYFIQYSPNDLQEIDLKDYKIYRANISLRYKGELVEENTYVYRKNVFRKAFYFKNDIHKLVKEKFEKTVPYLHSYNAIGRRVKVESNAQVDIFLKTELMANYTFRPNAVDLEQANKEIKFQF